jgi:hypothetical protein
VVSSTSPSSGIAGIVSFRRLHDYPLVVLTGADTADTFRNGKESRSHAIMTGTGATAIVLLLGGFWASRRLRIGHEASKPNTIPPEMRS